MNYDGFRAWLPGLPFSEPPLPSWAQYESERLRNGLRNHRKPGDAVFGLTCPKESGPLGQAVVTNDTFIVQKPDNISFEQPACRCTPGVTAWNGLTDKVRPTAGKHIFVNAQSRWVPIASLLPKSEA
jgi:hypothetical protein